MHLHSTISYQELFQIVLNIFRKYGYTISNARIATTNLLNADIRGIDSHGIARLSGYLRLIDHGRINVKAIPSVVVSTATTATIDADRSLGLVVGNLAIKTAIKKAKRYGTGWVAVNNSSHFGIAASYAMQALEHDMIGIAMTNASAIVAPTFSKSRMLGTNPIAVAIPAGDQPAFVADFSTATTANGKLEIAQSLGKDIPTGWAITRDGTPTTDAAILKSQGALLPLGSSRDMGSHKGYAMSSIVDILTGVLSGANYGPWVPPFPAYIPMPTDMPGLGIGHFFGAMRIDAFQSIPSFKGNMDQWITAFRNAKRIDDNQEVLIPGDPERIATSHRMQHGIELTDGMKSELKTIMNNLKLKIPKTLQ